MPEEYGMPQDEPVDEAVERREARPGLSIVMSTRVEEIWDETEIEQLEELAGAEFIKGSLGDTMSSLQRLFMARGRKMNDMADDAAQLASEIAIYEERVRKFQPQLDALNTQLNICQRLLYAAEQRETHLKAKLQARNSVIGEMMSDQLLQHERRLLQSWSEEAFGGETDDAGQ